MKKISAIAAVIAMVSAGSASAWWGGPGGYGNNWMNDRMGDGMGDGAFNMNMNANTSARGWGRGYNRYNGYGYGAPYGYGYGADVRRGLFIEDFIYSVSSIGIQSHDTRAIADGAKASLTLNQGSAQSGDVYCGDMVW